MTDLTRSRVRFGPFEADLVARELWKSGMRVKLSGQPYQILAALLEQPGQLVAREELRKRIWSEDTFVDFGHGLNAAVNKLREALCDSADHPLYIETLPRRGYRFIGVVEDISPAPVALPAPLPTSAAPEPFSKGTLIQEKWEDTIPVQRQLLAQASAFLVLLVLLGIGAVLYLTQKPAASLVEEAQEREDAAQNVLPRTESKRVREPQRAGRAVELAPSIESAVLRLEQTGQHLRLSDSRSSTEGPAILRFDLAHASNLNSLTRILGGYETIAGPQPSPDGKKLVFMAGRNDSMEIWVCNMDGSSPRQLTTLGRTGTPRWSPDGRWIVFDSDGRFGRAGIYVVSANGGAVRAIVDDDSNNTVPSWSRDGKYIYFGSNRDWNEAQLWKVPAAGGQPVQITRRGGYAAFESADGTVYYAKNGAENPEIWQVPANGGEETRVPLVRPSTWADWALTNKGILFLTEYTGHKSELEYFVFADRSLHSLVTLENPSFWLASTANGSSVWYSELTEYQARAVFKAGL